MPALFGENLKKNIIYDLLNDNCIDNIHEDDVYQWYSLTDLTNDIKIIIESDTQVAVVPEPIGNKEILKLFPKVHIKQQDLNLFFQLNVASMFNSDNKYAGDQASILKGGIYCQLQKLKKESCTLLIGHPDTQKMVTLS